MNKQADYLSSQQKPEMKVYGKLESEYPEVLVVIHSKLRKQKVAKQIKNNEIETKQ